MALAVSQGPDEMGDLRLLRHPSGLDLADETHSELTKKKRF
jgi:hypothetical protein